MRFSFVLAFIFLTFTVLASAQSITFGGIVGAGLTNDYRTFSYPVQLPPNLDPSGFGFGLVSSGPRHLLAGPMGEVGFTPHISIEADALYHPVSYRNSAARSNGSIFNMGAPIRTASWEFPLLAKYRFRLPLSPFIESGVSLRPAGNGSNLSHAGFTAGAGVEWHAKAVKIAPMLRYTRWAHYSTGLFEAKRDQLELLVSVNQRAESWSPTAFGRKLSLGLVAGVALGDDIQPFSGYANIRRPESNSAIVGAMLEAQLVSNVFLEADGIYRPMHWAEYGFRPLYLALLTWEFPVLAKYKLPGRRFRPLLELGPAFRASGNLNGAMPSEYGVTGGVGVEARLRWLKIAPVLRYTRWARDPSDGNPPQTFPNRVELLVGFSF